MQWFLNSTDDAHVHSYARVSFTIYTVYTIKRLTSTHTLHMHQNTWSAVLILEREKAPPDLKQVCVRESRFHWSHLHKDCETHTHEHVRLFITLGNCLLSEPLWRNRPVMNEHLWHVLNDRNPETQRPTVRSQSTDRVQFIHCRTDSAW